MNIVFYEHENARWIHLFSVPWPSNRQDQRKVPIINGKYNISVTSDVKYTHYINHVNITTNDEMLKINEKFNRVRELTTCLSIDRKLPRHITRLILTISSMMSTSQEHICHLIVERRLTDENEIQKLAHQFPNVEYLELLFPFGKIIISSLTRRSYIEAKYVQKAFLRSLPASNQMRSSTRTIKRWSVMKSSISTANTGNENDDDTSHTLKVNNRQLLTRRLTAPSDNDTTTDNPPAIWNMNIYLYEGARHRNVPMMLHALALGADKNFFNEHDHGRTPLIQTILSRSIAAAEFLLTNNAKVNLADEDGRTPLHYATPLANKGRGPIILLLKRGADPLLKDHNGIDACSLSMTIGDPDVITWYRLIALHEQMKQEDADAEKTYISILDDPVYMKEIARTPSFS
ncbi:unnamed protein product [Rotaria sp. Silwood2]|nr:unnamed protein product [Rotaria sp. Silwood2]